MKNALLIILAQILSLAMPAQTTAIPDANFEQALINLGYDTGIPDGFVPTTNIASVSSLSISNLGINDLTGIEDFTSLKRLWCLNNLITDLDISQNTILEILNCSNNQLLSLDISQNFNLTGLACGQNQLSNLNISQNINLIGLGCSFNQLSNLNVSQNLLLGHLLCNNNQITSLDLSQTPSIDTLYCGSNNLLCLNLKNGNNTNIINVLFNAVNNPNLSCIEVDDAVWSTANWSNIDASSSFSNSCVNTCTLGIDNNSFSNIQYYPNPTNSKITIKLEEVKYNLEVTVINGIGQSLETYYFDNTDRFVLDLSYPVGFYYIKLKTPSQRNTMIKIIIE